MDMQKKLCCKFEEKINKKAEIHSDNVDHYHLNEEKSNFQMFLPAILSFTLLLIAIGFDNYFKQSWFTGLVRIGWYIVAQIPVGFPVIREALVSIKKGEIFQSLAVTRAKANIKTLLDQRPYEVTILENNVAKTIKTSTAKIGDIIQLKAGQKLGLDGEFLSDTASFNTAALTSESKPDTKAKGETVLAGIINLNMVCQVKVTVNYSDSKLSKILVMVQNSTAQKAPTELFIRKFAKIYTPIVALLAILNAVRIQKMKF